MKPPVEASKATINPLELNCSELFYASLQMPKGLRYRSFQRAVPNLPAIAKEDQQPTTCRNMAWKCLHVLLEIVIFL